MKMTLNEKINRLAEVVQALCYVLSDPKLRNRTWLVSETLAKLEIIMRTEVEVE